MSLKFNLLIAAISVGSAAHAVPQMSCDVLVPVVTGYNREPWTKKLFDYYWGIFEVAGERVDTSLYTEVYSEMKKINLSFDRLRAFMDAGGVLEWDDKTTHIQADSLTNPKKFRVPATFQTDLILRRVSKRHGADFLRILAELDEFLKLAPSQIGASHAEVYDHATKLIANTQAKKDQWPAVHEGFQLDLSTLMADTVLDLKNEVPHITKDARKKKIIDKREAKREKAIPRDLDFVETPDFVKKTDWLRYQAQAITAKFRMSAERAEVEAKYQAAVAENEKLHPGEDQFEAWNQRNREITLEKREDLQMIAQVEGMQIEPAFQALLQSVLPGEKDPTTKRLLEMLTAKPLADSYDNNELYIPLLQTGLAKERKRDRRRFEYNEKHFENLTALTKDTVQEAFQRVDNEYRILHQQILNYAHLKDFPGDTGVTAHRARLEARKALLRQFNLTDALKWGNAWQTQTQGDGRSTPPTRMLSDDEISLLKKSMPEIFEVTLDFEAIEASMKPRY